MSRYTHGADALERLANHYKDLVVAREALNELGGLDAAKEVLQTSITRMREELETIKGDTAVARTKLIAAQAEANRLIEDAQQKAYDILQQAAANSTKAIAQQQAEALLNEARSKYQAEATQAEERAQEAEKRVKLAQSQLEQITTEQRKVQGDVHELTKQLETMKDRIRKLMSE